MDSEKECSYCVRRNDCKMRILLIGNSSSPYLSSLVKALKLDNSTALIDILDPFEGVFAKDGCEKIRTEDMKYRNNYLWRLFFIRTCIKEYYDICNVHYNSPMYFLVASVLKKSCKTLVVSIWGSDLRSKGGIGYRLQRRLIQSADVVTINNPTKISSLIENYDLDESIVEVAPMPLALLDRINALKAQGTDRAKAKEHLGFSKDVPLIVCGTNGKSEQQHLEILSSLEERVINSPLLRGCEYVFPLTYSVESEHYLRNLKNKLRKSSLNTKVVVERYSDEDMAMLRIATDFLIHVQSIDMFSAVMQESLFAGGCVVTGDWLPYEFLKENVDGLFSVGSCSEIGEVLELNLKYDSKQINQEYIYRLASVEHCAERWKSIYARGPRNLV